SFFSVPDDATFLGRFHRLPKRSHRLSSCRHFFHDRFRYTHPRHLKPFLFGFDDPRQDVRPIEVFHKPATLTRRFAAPSPSGRGTVLKSIPLPLGEGAAKRRV